MRKNRRKFSVEDKLSLLRACDQIGIEMTFRKHHLARSLLYRDCCRIRVLKISFFPDGYYPLVLPLTISERGLPLLDMVENNANFVLNPLIKTVQEFLGYAI